MLLDYYLDVNTVVNNIDMGLIGRAGFPFILVLYHMVADGGLINLES